MNNANQLALGSVLADEAIQRTGRKNPEFVADAVACIRTCCTGRWQNRTFTSEDIWPWLNHAPTDNRAIGAAFRKAHKEGLIEPDGWENCTRASRHCAPIRRWRAKT